MYWNACGKVTAHRRGTVRTCLFRVRDHRRRNLTGCTWQRRSHARGNLWLNWLPSWHVCPKLLVNVKGVDKAINAPIIPDLVNQAKSDLEGAGSGLLGPSGMEPLSRVMVEGPELREAGPDCIRSGPRGVTSCSR